jgi:hypothetical protein
MMTKRAQKIMEAFHKDETWDKEPLPDKIVVANVLRETINQLQNGAGMISAPDMLKLSEEIEDL